MKFLKKQPRGLCQPCGGHALGKAALGWVGSIPDARGEPGAGQGVRGGHRGGEGESPVWTPSLKARGWGAGAVFLSHLLT